MNGKFILSKIQKLMLDIETHTIQKRRQQYQPVVTDKVNKMVFSDRKQYSEVYV